MSNLEQIHTLRKYRKRRRALSRVGTLLAVVGFCMMILSTGEGDVSFLVIISLSLAGCSLFGIGVSIVSFVDRMNEERPLVYKPKYKGDDLWYNMYINLKKRSGL